MSDARSSDEPVRGEKTALVRELAGDRGVTERTVWRWIANLEASGAGGLPAAERSCDYCGQPLPETASARRRFCDDTCRVYFNREQEAPSRDERARTR